MNLPFRRRNTVQSNPIIPEMNGPVQPTSTGSGVRWVRLVILVIVGLVILTALIAGGMWTYDKAVNHSSKPTVATSNNSSKKSSPSKQSSSASKPVTTSKPTTTTPASNSSASAASVNQNTQNPQPAAATGNLSNTGPGDTFAIFAATTIFGAVVYHLVLRKRLS